MQIAKDVVVALDYTLKNDDGEIVDTSEGKEPLYYLHGHHNIVEGLEEALTGKVVGDEVVVTVPPEKGYGVRKDDLVFDVPLTQLPAGLNPRKGMRLTMSGPNGGGTPCTVTRVKVSSITVDANHELADQNLHFSVAVRILRKATKDELKHGHAHAPGHHHH